MSKHLKYVYYVKIFIHNTNNYSQYKFKDLGQSPIQSAQILRSVAKIISN